MDFTHKNSINVTCDSSQLGPLSPHLQLEPSHEDPHNAGQILLSEGRSQITQILSDFTFWQHNCITVQKNRRFLTVEADFPMPSANHHPHKFHFSALMSGGLFAGP